MATTQNHEADAALSGHRLLEIAGIAAFAGISIMIGAWLVARADQFVGWEVALYLTTATFMGWLIADFASGFVHWLGDTFGTEEMPVLGEAFIKPFRQHHVDPKGITRHDFIETNGNNCIVVCLFLHLPMASLYFLSGGLQYWLVAVGLVLGVATFFTNQIHRWSHLDNPPWYAVAFQKLGLFMTADHHSVHHTAPYDTYYCITTGWLNPVLDKTRFFDHMERLIRAGLARIR